jgi:O-antigen/teichoic acid export membrane protein
MRVAQDLKSRLVERFVSSVVALATNVIFARELGASGYGELAFVIALTAVFLPVAKFGIGGRLTHALLKDANNNERLIEAAITWRLLGGTTAILIALALVYVAPAFSSASSLLVLCVLQSLAVYSVLEFRFDSSLLATKLLVPRLSVLFVFAALKWVAVKLSGSIFIVVLMIGLEFFFGALVTLMVYRSEFAHLPQPAKISRAITQFGPGTFWVVLSGLMEIVYLKSDVLFLKLFQFDAQIGVYSLAARVVEVTFIFPPLIVTSVLSGAFQASGGRLVSDRKLRGIGTLLFLAGMLVSLVLLILSPLLPALVGDEYQLSGAILMIYCWCAPFIFLRTLLSKMLILRDLLPFSLYTTLSGALLNITLNTTLIPFFGACGAAISTVISYSVAGWFSLYFFRSTRPLAALLTQSVLSVFNRKGLLNAIAFVRRTNRYSRI